MSRWRTWRTESLQNLAIFVGMLDNNSLKMHFCILILSLDKSWSNRLGIVTMGCRKSVNDFFLLRSVRIVRKTDASCDIFHKCTC